MFLYECHCDLIDHLLIEACSMRVALAVIFRVQTSLIIISMYALPEKLVSSLITICKVQTLKMSFLPKLFNQIQFVIEQKHKKQELVLEKNRKKALNRISNF